jgi:phosphatidylethanolamine/phosphatidyl-N-methylethanolamine N-methyltransferase
MKNIVLEVWKRPRHSKRLLRAWMRSPFTVGAVVPSSRFLARAIAAEVQPEQPGYVIELGAGTGVVTQALLHRGCKPDTLMVIERDTHLAHFLTQHFPQLNIVCADATQLQGIMGSLKVHRVQAVVSSLPLLSMPRSIRLAVEAQMAATIGEEGKIVQFTYGPRSPISDYTAREYGLVGRRVKTVLCNLPPAHVWVYEKGRPPLSVEI